MNSFVPILLTVTTDDSKWSLGNLLSNATSTLEGWGGLALCLFGVVMILVGCFQIGKGFITHGKGNTNWIIAILCLVVGGAFLAGGWNFVADIARGGKQTIQDLGTGSGAVQTILPMSPFVK